MYNKSNRKQAKIQTQNYNYLQDLYGNSGITSQQLIYKGEIQNVINKLTEKERPNALMKLTINDYVCHAQKLTCKKK